MSAASPSSGLYIHFPYCDRRCPYCDFVLATPRVAPSAAYTDALLAEWRALRVHEGEGPLATLYVGGGTPSLWDPAELARLVRALEEDRGFAPAAERTLEANPEQVDARWLDAVFALGFNRISLGVQSITSDGLERLGRAHDPARALDAIASLRAAQREGALRSFSVDLIYGWQGQTMDAFRDELAALHDVSAAPHLSLYALTVETRTVLGKKVRDGLVPPPDDGLQADMMFSARELLAARGLTHYEVSSWAAPGHGAVHNGLYWDMAPWIGLGAGAAGFTGARRYRNQPVIRRYLEGCAAPALTTAAVEAEASTPDADELAFDAVMTGLRRLDVGLALTPALEARFAGPVAAGIAAGRLVRGDGGRLRLTDAGLRFMDDVLLTFL